MLRHHRNHVVDRGIDARGGGMAARLDFPVAGIVGDAVDHRLRPRIHVLEAHVGEAGDVLQAFGRQRQRERLAEIGGDARRELVEDAVGMGLKLPDPGVAHRARRHRREHRGPLRHVRIAVLAHHVVPHQHVHQAGRLVRGEHVDALLLREDVVAPREHRGVELRHERDRRFLCASAPASDRIGPECRYVDVEMRGVGHGGLRWSGSRRRPSRSSRRHRPTCRRRGRWRGRRCLRRCRHGRAGCGRRRPLPAPDYWRAHWRSAASR